MYALRNISLRFIQENKDRFPAVLRCQTKKIEESNARYGNLKAGGTEKTNIKIQPTY